MSIGADFAIYLLFRVREELLGGHALEVALRDGLRTSGKAVFYVSSRGGRWAMSRCRCPASACGCDWAVLTSMTVALSALAALRSAAARSSGAAAALPDAATAVAAGDRRGDRRAGRCLVARTRGALTPSGVGRAEQQVAVHPAVAVAGEQHALQGGGDRGPEDVPRPALAGRATRGSRSAGSTLSVIASAAAAAWKAPEAPNGWPSTPLIELDGNAAPELAERRRQHGDLLAVEQRARSWRARRCNRDRPAASRSLTRVGGWRSRPPRPTASAPYMPCASQEKVPPSTVA